jgi:hydrogenase-4 component F
VQGALQRVPWSGSILLGGFLAVSAFPPSLLFLSEFTIVTAAFSQGSWLAAALLLVALAVVFLGMAPIVLGMVLGDPPDRLPSTRQRERLLTVAPPLVLLLLVALLGVWLPPPLAELLRQAAALLRGGYP